MLAHAQTVSLSRPRTEPGFEASVLCNALAPPGLMVYLDEKHWLKAGLEIENGKPNMSCVVTNGESDWNYIPWPAKEARLRVTVTQYPRICDCQVEYESDDGGEWFLLRDACISLTGEEEVRVGLLCAAPKKETENDGMEAFFKYLTIQGDFKSAT